MMYAENWPKAKERICAWWQGEVLDRCCASIVSTAPYAPARPKPSDKAGLFAYRTDPEWIVARSRENMAHTWYGGEAFPLVMPDLGAAGHAGFFKGAEYQFEESTVWFGSKLKSVDEMQFDEQSYLFKQTLAIVRALAEDSRGDYMVSMSDCSGNADVLSHLFGPENLLPMLIEEPEAVQAAMQKVQQAYESIHRQTYEIVKGINEGGSCVGWLRTWAPGFHSQMQSDMSVMISANMFREFVEPELRAQCDFLEYPLYHFDGIEQIRHLDSLLSIEKLRVIQWTQVVGQPPCTEFIPQLQRIQQAGKNLLICAEPKQIRPLMENLSSKGLYLLLWASSPEEGEAMLREIAALTHD